MLCDLILKFLVSIDRWCIKNFEMLIIVDMGWQIVFNQSTVMSDYQC